MKDRTNYILKEKVRQRLESYMKQNNIKFNKRPVNEETAQVLDAQKKEVAQSIATKQEEIKALTTQIANLKKRQAELSTKKPDENT
jgi:hypothetical protein